jgi:hypothetical protein
MTPIKLATLIGNILTQIDAMLSDPGFPMSDPDWQTLYALRKHLDDMQRLLIQATIEATDASYIQLTKQITAANKDLQGVIKDLDKIDAIVKTIAQIAALVDQVLKLKP